MRVPLRRNRSGRIAFDLGVEREEARLHFGDMGTHRVAMLDEQGAALGFGRGAFGAQRGVAQHALNRQEDYLTYSLQINTLHRNT
ncbi:hypothetical protein [Paraburkholderia sp. SIMBA_027]|uniref:hypothetical protein n=1 Tax=Paraburkholderia sp. SIMBA_027 TaxID=3085770 RepID=UPI00397BCD17